MEIIECDVCKAIITHDSHCSCSHSKDYLYGVVYTPAQEEE
jgi:hypothetical protein